MRCGAVETLHLWLLVAGFCHTLLSANHSGQFCFIAVRDFSVCFVPSSVVFLIVPLRSVVATVHAEVPQRDAAGNEVEGGALTTVNLEWRWGFRDSLSLANLAQLGATFSAASQCGNEPGFVTSFAAGMTGCSCQLTS